MSEQMFEVLNARFHKNGFELRHSKTQVQTNKPSVANTQRCKSTNENVCLQTQGANLTNDREYCLCLCVSCVYLSVPALRRAGAPCCVTVGLWFILK